MNSHCLRLAILATALIHISLPAESAESCPRTIGSDRVFLEPWPQAETWFGSESLAVILPENGLWPTTVDGHLIAVKLFWYSAGFQPGLERDFVGRIERIGEGPNDATISRPTNALLGNEVWTILTGIDFKSPGCWKVSGEYQGQALEFVVETIPHTEIATKLQDDESLIYLDQVLINEVNPKIDDLDLRY